MKGNEIIVPEFGKEDYLNSTEPFEWVYQFKDNKLRMEQAISLVSEQAISVKIKNFRTMFKTYLKSLRTQNDFIEKNATNFTDQEMELECGAWYADDDGIFQVNGFGIELLACNHPIMPIKRLVNIDTGVEKLELAFRKGRGWRKIIADKKTLASANSILQLADYGVAVNSENAKHLVRYLTDIEHLNYGRLDEVNSVGRLGWIDDYGFSPYVENLVFDGDASFKHFFESVRRHGDYDKWKDLAREVRRDGVCARLMLAASFASVLIKPCGALPFFVHLWGGTETGKTVGLLLAASVWANPEVGRYIHTFNTTAVGQELSAGFVNSMPLIMDELQIVKDKKDFDTTIYQLTEGIGRTRGQKAGGLQRVSTWQNCILTTGEMPIGSASSGSGAINRIIEVDCQDIKLFKDPIRVADIIKKNYGFAGKEFVELLQDDGHMEYTIQTQKEFYRTLSEGDSTEKQALSASLILTADHLIDKWILHDGIRLAIPDIEPYLSTKADVSQHQRTVQYIYDFVAINQQRFQLDKYGELQGEVWGTQDDDYVYIIKAQFDKILRAEGYNSTAFLSWAQGQEIVKCEKGRKTKKKKINGQAVNCVWLKCTDDDEDIVYNEQLPF